MKLMIVAGEASGDAHGAQLMPLIQDALPGIDIYGVGGPKMLRAGLRAYYGIDALQVHGFVEVIQHLPRLYRILWNLADSIEEEKPDLVVLIDYPGFNLKLAHYAKQAGVPVIFFSSPQVWAWRKGRLKTIKKVVDLMLVLYPFEKPIYEEAGIPVSFIGHPMVNQSLESDQIQSFKNTYALDPKKPLVALVPGSRPSEVNRHLPVLLETIERPEVQERSLQFVMPVADTISKEVIEEEIQQKRLPVTLVQGGFLESIYASQAAVVCSGTATLQTSLALTPFVLIYKVSWFSYWIAKALANIPFLGMPNIIAGRPIIKELIQQQMTAASVAHELLRLVEDTAYREKVTHDLEQIKHQLGVPGAYERAAQDIVRSLKQRLKQ